MSKQKITLKKVKGVLNHDRSVSKTVNILKYVAMFLDQREIGPKLVKNTIDKLKELSKEGMRITENVVAQTFTNELHKLLKGTKFWDNLTFTQKLTTAKQILYMSATNRLLQMALTQRININDFVDEIGFEELTNIKELTPGQIWNLKMQEAKRKKKLERELEAKKTEEIKEKEEAKAQSETMVEAVEIEEVESTGDMWDDLRQYMTEEEIQELKELNDLT